jgi:hypothetical protein
VRVRAPEGDPWSVLRTKDGREIDFAVIEEGKPPLLIEVKYSDDTPSPSFSHFAGFFQAP